MLENCWDNKEKRKTKILNRDLTKQKFLTKDFKNGKGPTCRPWVCHNHSYLFIYKSVDINWFIKLKLVSTN